jgi:hypothetical protein
VTSQNDICFGKRNKKRSKIFNAMIYAYHSISYLLYLKRKAKKRWVKAKLPVETIIESRLMMRLPCSLSRL